MHQIVCRLGLRSRVQTPLGAYSAPPDSLAVFRGLTSKGREKMGEEGRGKEEQRKGRREERRGVEGGSSSFALERKKRKVGAYVQDTEAHTADGKWTVVNS